LVILIEYQMTLCMKLKTQSIVKGFSFLRSHEFISNWSEIKVFIPSPPITETHLSLLFIRHQNKYKLEKKNIPIGYSNIRTKI
jgi:hypothetical protein